MVKIEDLTVETLDRFFSLFERVVNEDFPEYSDKVKKFFLTKDYSKETFRNFLGRPFRKVSIAVEDELEGVSGSVVGYLVGDHTYGGVGFVSFFGVEKSRRRNGIGTELIKAYEDFSKGKKAHMVKLYTFNRIMPFYEKLGYEHIGEEKTGYWGTRNQVMGKMIGEWDEETLEL